MSCLSLCSYRFSAEAHSLARLVTRVLSGTLSAAEREAVVEHAIIRLHDCWSNRVRQLIVLSAIGGHISRSGRRLPRVTRLPARRSPVHQIRHIWTGKIMSDSWEPKWYAPADATRCAQLLGVANLVEIAGGLGASLRADELRTVRNLVAHRVPHAWQRFRKATSSMPPNCNAIDFVTSIDTATGLPVMSTWVLDLTSALHAAAQ